MVAVNVAQLLKSHVGSTRELEFDETEPQLERSAGVRGPLTGRAHLLRTGRGILVEAEYGANVELECGRCLDAFLASIEGAVEEEFLPQIDVNTGLPLPLEGDELRLSENHILDLNEAMRQDILVRLPLQPLCQTSCPGLCPQCGAVWSRETCGCRPASPESPFQALAELLNMEGLERKRKR